MDTNNKEFPNKNISRVSISKRRKKNSKIPECFAYPNDEAGLPQPVPNFPPIPENLLDYSRQKLRQAIKDEINTLIDWALTHPKESLEFRKIILKIS